MGRSVVVIGAGLAGLAAAWSARRRGLRVTVVSSGAGASALAGGAVDDVPWEQRVRAAALLARLDGRSAGGTTAHPTALSPQVQELSAELGLWDLPDEALPELATLAGRIRTARGRDRALLDVGGLRRTRVLVPRAERPGWDADALAATLADEPAARARGLRFVPVDAHVLRHDDERRIPDGDLAARHDDRGRLDWLAGALREVVARHGGAGAVLLGPWLGARAGRAEALSAAVGLPVGEALAGAGSPAGLRFEAARDALLQAIGADHLREGARAIELLEDAARAAVLLQRNSTRIVADAVVLAIGGILGGGVAYLPPEHFAGADLPPGACAPFALSLSAPVALSDGPVSSLHGPDLDTIAWPSGDRAGTLEAVGIRCDGVRAATGIYAVGDAIAGRHRTVLEAVSSGLRAGDEV